MTHTGICVIGC